MKNFMYLAIISLVLLLPFGCTKKYHGDLEEYRSNCPKPENYKISSLASFNGNMATFNNEDDYNRFIVKCMSLNATEEIELINSINYLTYQALMDSLYLILDSLETREDVLQFIANNEDYFELILNDENEEEIHEINEANGLGSQIYNADNMIQVGGEFYKFFQNYVIIGQNIDVLKSIKTKIDMENSGVKYHEIYSTLSSGNSDINSRMCNDLGVYIIRRSDRQPSGCRNHRRVKLTWALDMAEFTVGDFKSKYIYMMTEVKPYKRGIPCIWYNYKTDVTRNNFHFS